MKFRVTARQGFRRTFVWSERNDQDREETDGQGRRRSGDPLPAKLGRTPRSVMVQKLRNRMWHGSLRL